VTSHRKFVVLFCDASRNCKRAALGRHEKKNWTFRQIECTRDSHFFVFLTKLSRHGVSGVLIMLDSFEEPDLFGKLYVASMLPRCSMVFQ